MNCARCFHTHEAHAGDGNSLMRKGACRIPGCTCNAFIDRIHRIDEELT